MDKAEKIEKVCRELDITTRRGQRMSNHTALGVGGEIYAIAYPETREAAARLIAELEAAEIKWSALGAGYSLLAGDDPIDRVAISLKLLEELLTFDGPLARVHGGYRVSRLVEAAVERGLAGIEGLATLNGTVGATISAGDRANSYEITAVIDSVSVARDGKVTVTSFEELRPGEMVLGGVLRLQAADRAALAGAYARYLKRVPAQARQARAVGPVFGNVRGRTPAGIITALGLKGASCGDAAIATWDGNYVVNTGAASARDVLGLIEMVRTRARAERGVELAVALEVWR